MNKVLATVFAVSGVAFVWLPGAWSLGLSDWESPDFVIFLGRFHPVVLHLPIGLLFLAFIIDVGRLASWGDQWPRTTGLMGLVTATAILASFHGILLFAGEGLGESELVRRHLIGGSVFATLAAAVFVFKIWASDGKHARQWGGGAVVLTFFVMGFTSHDGASITHGAGYLTQYAPGVLKGLFGGETVKEMDDSPFAERDIFEVTVQPVLNQTCVKCHRAEKSAGGLRMDSYAEFAAGGKNGPVFVPGNAEASLFLQRIYLPVDDEEHMPPQSHPQPTPEQIELLAWWVESGASEVGALASFSPNEKVMHTVRVLNTVKRAKKEGTDVRKIDLENLSTEVRKFNDNLTGKLTFVLAGEPVLHFDCFDGPDLVNDEVLQRLVPFAPHLQIIDLNGSNVTTAGVVSLLEHAEQLERLSLNDCAINDPVIDAAMDCASLQSISLMGTQITNAGLARLVRHPGIQNIYAGNSAVTPEGKQRALELLSRPEIILGQDESL